MDPFARGCTSALRRITVILLFSASFLLLAQVGTASAASTWYRLSTAGGSNSDRAAFVRSGGVLRVLFRHDPTNAKPGLYLRTVSAAGVPAASTELVLGDWEALTNPDIVSDGAGFRILFSGLRSVDTSDPYASGNLYSLTGGPGAWALQAPHGASNQAYASIEVSAARALDGTLMTSWTGTSLLMLDTNLGASQQDLEASCCPYSSNFGSDTSQTAVWLGWFSNVSGRYGQYVRLAYPTLGEPIYLPGSASASKNSAVSLGDRLAITGRIGASGVYSAYCAGYPSCTALRLNRAGTTGAVTLTTPTKTRASIRNVDIAAAPQGRLWVMWNSQSKVYAARTNKAATKLGAVQAFAGPTGATSIYDVSGQGSSGPLDLVGNFSATSGTSLWTRHVFPALSLRALPTVADNDKVTYITFRVSDAGDPVPGAKVKFLGTSHVTNAAGKTTFTVAKVTSTGFKAAVATRAGYVPAKAAVRVID